MVSPSNLGEIPKLKQGVSNVDFSDNVFPVSQVKPHDSFEPSGSRFMSDFGDSKGVDKVVKDSDFQCSAFSFAPPEKRANISDLSYAGNTQATVGFEWRGERRVRPERFESPETRRRFESPARALYRLRDQICRWVLRILSS